MRAECTVMQNLLLTAQLAGPGSVMAATEIHLA